LILKRVRRGGNEKRGIEMAIVSAMVPMQYSKARQRMAVLAVKGCLGIKSMEKGGEKTSQVGGVRFRFRRLKKES